MAYRNRPYQGHNQSFATNALGYNSSQPPAYSAAFSGAQYVGFSNCQPPLQSFHQRVANNQVGYSTNHSTPIPTPQSNSHSSGEDAFTLKQIRRELANIVRPQPPITRKPGFYNQVHVLLLHWTGDPAFNDELWRLRRIFKQGFNFHTVRKYQMPLEDAQVAVEAYVGTWIEKFGGAKSLLVVYYSGHGGVEADGSVFWADGQANSPRMNWSAIQPLLENAPAQVLLLLDTCYAGASTPSHPNNYSNKINSTHKAGTTELLAACGFDNKANMPGPASFTEVLIQTLQGFLDEGKAFSTQILAKRVLEKMKGLRYAGDGGSGGEVRGKGLQAKIPMFHRLVGGSNRAPILVRSFGTKKKKEERAEMGGSRRRDMRK